MCLHQIFRLFRKHQIPTTSSEEQGIDNGIDTESQQSSQRSQRYENMNANGKSVDDIADYRVEKQDGDLETTSSGDDLNGEAILDGSAKSNLKEFESKVPANNGSQNGGKSSDDLQQKQKASETSKNKPSSLLNFVSSTFSSLTSSSLSSSNGNSKEEGKVRKSLLDKPKDEPILVCVIGCGLLGTRIAIELALNNVTVKVYDQGKTRRELVAKSRGIIQELQQRKFFPENEEGDRVFEKIMSKIEVCDSLEKAVKDVDFVSEAVPDRLDVKRSVFSKVEKLCNNPNAVFTTNTLTVPLADVAAILHNPKRLVGLRFLYPVILIPFVEITVSSENHNSTSAHGLVEILNRIGKIAFHFYLTEPGTTNRVRPRRTDAEMAADFMPGSSNEMRYNITFEEAMSAQENNGYARFRLTPREYMMHQGRESKKKFANIEESPPEELCCICLSEKPTTYIASCGHKVLCLKCATVILRQGRAACPVCRQEIRGLKRVADIND